MNKLIVMMLFLCSFAGAAVAAPVFENTDDGKMQCEEYLANGNGDFYTPRSKHRNYGKNHQKDDTQKSIQELIEAKGHKAPAVCINAEVVGGRKWVAVSSELVVWTTAEGKIRSLFECDNPVYEIHLMKRRPVAREEVVRPEVPRVVTEVIVITQVPQVTQVQITPVPAVQVPVIIQNVPMPAPAVPRPRIAYEHMLVIPVIPYTYQRPAPMFYGNTGGCCTSQLPAPVYHGNPGFSGGTNPMR